MNEWRGELVIRPLTPDLLPDVADLFGEKGACGRCWCMYWRIGSAYRSRPASENRGDFFDLVRRGPPPGLLAFAGGKAVGWCQVTPRTDLPRLRRSRRLTSPGDIPVWAISCLYVRIGHRRRGVTSALILGAIEFARAAGSPAVEAYPLDAALSPSATGTGYSSTFLRLGFREVARHFAPRPILRFDLTHEA